MHLLDKIITHKRKEVEERKQLFPIKLLERSIYFSTSSVSLRKYVTRSDKSGIIAEIKRKSPSLGDINPYVSIERTSIGYMQAGASALSILTDSHFFGGANEDLTEARKFNFCPILRKDFIVDEYQVVEAKSIGADAILLIAAVLTNAETKALSELAHSMGLEVLLEIHDKEELNSRLDALPDLVGVNNRDLKTFKVDVDVSRRLGDSIPGDITKVSESGIESPEVIVELKGMGYDGFLVGQHFMKDSRPERVAMEFISELRRMELLKVSENAP